MSARGFVHVNADGSAVLVTDEGVSASTAPSIDLTHVVRGLTLATDSGQVTWDQGIRLRMYRVIDENPDAQPPPDPKT